MYIQHFGWRESIGGSLRIRVAVEALGVFNFDLGLHLNFFVKTLRDSRHFVESIGCIHAAKDEENGEDATILALQSNTLLAIFDRCVAILRIKEVLYIPEIGIFQLKSSMQKQQSPTLSQPAARQE